MKKNINYLLTIVAIIFVTCSTNESMLPIATQSSVPIVLDGQETAFHPLGEGEYLKIEVKAIDESRCPSDVVCAGEGFVKVTFYITNIDQTIELATSNSGALPKLYSNGRKFSIAENNYELRLKNVTPYPTTENQEVKKSVEITLIQYF